MGVIKMKWMKNIGKEFFIESIIFWSAVAVAGFFFDNNFIVTLFFIILAAIRILIYHKKDDIFFFISGAILGPLSEILLVSLGVWKYTNPTLLGIPIWLPIAWGLAILMIKRLAEVFLYIKIK